MQSIVACDPDGGSSCGLIYVCPPLAILALVGFENLPDYHHTAFLQPSHPQRMSSPDDDPLIRTFKNNYLELG